MNEMDSKTTKYFVEVSEEMYGTVATVKHYSPECGKTLKKLWKHLLKTVAPFVDVRAFVESEDGELTDVSLYWYNEELEIREMVGLC